MSTRTTNFGDGIDSFHIEREGLSWVLLLPLAIAVAIGIGGCDLTGSDSDRDAVDRTLEAGGMAKTESGARLMAATEAIDKPVSVSGQEARDPTGETPLPEGARVPGPFYRISAKRDIDIPVSDAPLYFALPVPDGADPSRLALGVRVPNRYVTDTGPSSPEYGWDLLESAYEPERNLLVVPARFLVSEGIVLTVVESGGYSSPSMAEAEGETLLEKTTSFFGEGSSTARTKSHGAGFKVKCKGGFNGGECGSDEKSDVRSYLKDVHGDFVSSFRSPDLKTPLFSKKYVWTIKKDGTAWCKGSTVGKYLSLTNTAITCYDGSGDPSEGTTRHEFFHAIQYNYAPISWSKLPKQRPDWVVEGTAELAADPRTAGSMHAIRDGNGRSLRSVNTPLTSNSGASPYEAQDFWVYMVNSRSSRTVAEVLDPLFKQQPSVPNKPTAEKVDRLYSLPGDYWEWVRNQAIGSRVTRGYDGALSAPCVFDPDVASPDTVKYDAGTRSGPKTISTDVSRLSAEAMVVQVETGSKRIDLTIESSTSEGNSYVRNYHRHSSATGDCWSSSKAASHTLTDLMKASSKKTYYAIMSATWTNDQSSSFSVEVSYSDRPTK